jgi:ribosome-dependent ATPase
MNTDSVIVLENLSKSFGNKVVVDNVSFDVKRGEIFGFLGPNGSGKSTVIRMLCGVLAQNSGKAYIEGIDTSAANNLVRKKVGYVSQKFGLYSDLSVKQNMEFYGGIYGISPERIKQRIQLLAEKTNLLPYLDNKAATLSGGWKQRLALACAILHEPSVLFLDEPTAGIDPVARREVWDLLFELSREGMTMLVTTHYMDEAERCDKVGYIYLSKLIALGSINELVNSPELYPSGHKPIVIKTNATMPVYQLLQKMPEVSNISLFGKNVHCVIPQELTYVQLEQKITTEIASVETLQIEEAITTLEDVFVALTKKQMAKERQSA